MNLLRKLGEYLWRRLPKKKITLGGTVYKIPIFSINLLALGLDHESWLDDIYTSVLRCKRGTFVDVGVNRGQTLMKLLNFAPDRQYIGFEPQVAPASAVEQFIVENNLTHCSIFPIALSNIIGAVKLSTRGEGYGSMFSHVASIVDTFRPGTFYTYSKQVFVIPGDEIFENLNIEDISLIKIDVEGAELEVIEGLSSTIERHKPFIIFEVLHNYLVVTGEDLSDEIISFRRDRVCNLEQKIRKKGYSIYHINDIKSLDKLDQIIPKNIPELSTTDYLAVPDDYEENFLKCMPKSRRIIR